MNASPAVESAYLTGRFTAMGCPCEVLIDSPNSSFGAAQMHLAQQEAARIEKKYSRYIKGNVVDQLNTSNGKKIAVDAETAALLDYAQECYALSEGLFDITTGILRQVWRFDGAEMNVQPGELAALRARIGWDKVVWDRSSIQLPPGFEIDFGGICKEYAADRILTLLMQRGTVSTLVNLGGDIAAAGRRTWSVGIEDVAHPGAMARTLPLRQGAVATSGTSKRFVRVDGETYSHILNPKTGWPVQQPPRSVTVAAKTCTEAGLWSTLAMLKGPEAEAFLAQQGLEFWCFR